MVWWFGGWVGWVAALGGWVRWVAGWLDVLVLAVSESCKIFENEIEDNEEAFKSSKRKSSLDLTLVNLSKKSKVDELNEDFIFDEPDASVYSRRLSPPSINLTGQ